MKGSLSNNAKDNVDKKNAFISTYASLKNLNSLSLFVTVIDNPNRICKTASKFR